MAAWLQGLGVSGLGFLRLLVTGLGVYGLGLRVCVWDFGLWGSEGFRVCSFQIFLDSLGSSPVCSFGFASPQCSVGSSCSDLP